MKFLSRIGDMMENIEEHVDDKAKTASLDIVANSRTITTYIMKRE
jgi:hypothetical protein